MKKRAVILSLLVLAFLAAAPASAGQVSIFNHSKFSYLISGRHMAALAEARTGDQVRCESGRQFTGHLYPRRFLMIEEAFSKP